MSFLAFHRQTMAMSKRASPLHICSRSSLRKQRRKRAVKKIEQSMRRLREEMQEIGEQQKCVREGQRQVREKFEAIEHDCQQLREETKQITEQSRSTQLRLILMFQILRARENNDISKATKFTQILRELIANQKKEK